MYCPLASTLPGGAASAVCSVRPASQPDLLFWDGKIAKVDRALVLAQAMLAEAHDLVDQFRIPSDSRLSPIEVTDLDTHTEDVHWNFPNLFYDFVNHRLEWQERQNQLNELEQVRVCHAVGTGINERQCVIGRKHLVPKHTGTSDGQIHAQREVLFVGV